MSRDKIVATATEIMAEEGYAGLSMRRLADRLGTSPMGIYYYFASKSELLGYLFSRHDGVADYRRDRLPEDPCERVVQASEAVVRFLEAQPWALAGILDGYIGFEEFTRNHLSDLTDGVRDLGLDGEEAAATVRGIWSIVIGEAVLRSSAPRPRSAPRPSASCTATMESYLAGRLNRVHSHAEAQ
ncbi:TetR/AcrR family transcriptional regulator [Tsukamurella asaccharolytica]|nr:TetR/AcrR family transcriptional regulator [Tsukamurella asaccharolytica]